MDAVVLYARCQITEIERIDRLAMNAELRRNAALREIERHRASFGQALRRASNDVVDAQFEQVRRTANRRSGCGMISALKLRANRNNARASTGRARPRQGAREAQRAKAWTKCADYGGSLTP